MSHIATLIIVRTLLIGVAPASALAVAVVGMFLTSFMQPMANGPLHAVLQAVVEPSMQGRVFTLVMSGAVAMTPLSLAGIGKLPASGMPGPPIGPAFCRTRMSSGVILQG